MRSSTSITVTRSHWMSVSASTWNSRFGVEPPETASEASPRSAIAPASCAAMPAASATASASRSG
jgi:hypothetical protein